MRTWISIAALAGALALAAPAWASDVGYIYGVVTTVDGDAYQGELRWGEEEAFWDDIFNATKTRNENLDYVDDEALDRMRRSHSSGWGFIFDDHDEDFTHVFAIRFGDLKRIHVHSGDHLVAEFRNGDELKLVGGSNDVGARITVVDPKLGVRRVKWNLIRTIEFRQTPAKLEKKLGDPLYGTVRTHRYDFTGQIQWDQDEDLSTDKLDGETRDGDVSIDFGNISSIRKHRSGSLVTLRSGTQLYLTGTNDVNRENRGIMVKVPGLGTVKVGWDDFERVTFLGSPPGTGQSYAEFGRGQALQGEVEAHGNRYRGRIVFDLDEAWDFELLQGLDGDTEYLIPFREIARIEPKGSDRADVTLRSGDTIELEKTQDVSHKNDGLLVFTSSHSPEYVAWRDIEAIRFR